MAGVILSPEVNGLGRSDCSLCDVLVTRVSSEQLTSLAE